MFVDELSLVMIASSHVVSELVTLYVTPTSFQLFTSFFQSARQHLDKFTNKAASAGNDVCCVIGNRTALTIFVHLQVDKAEAEIGVEVYTALVKALE